MQAAECFGVLVVQTAVLQRTDMKDMIRAETLTVSYHISVGLLRYRKQKPGRKTKPGGFRHTFVKIAKVSISGNQGKHHIYYQGKYV